VCAASLCEDLPSSTLGGREEVFTRLSCGPRGITGGYRDHSFTSRSHSNNAGAASAVVKPKQRRTPRRNQNCEYSHDPEHRRTACPPELAVPYRIDAEGQKRPPLTLKGLGARHRLPFFYQHWCAGCHSHGFPTLQALVQDPRTEHVGIASPDRIRGRLRQYARQVTLGPAALRPPDSLRPRGPFVARRPSHHDGKPH